MDVADLLKSNLYKNINHRDSLQELAQGAKDIKIVCPFISMAGATWLIKNIQSDVSLQIVTEVSARGLASGVQSPEVLKYLFEHGAKIYFLESHLHAKLYWFDNESIFITSANLTDNGLSENFELGVLFEKKRIPVFDQKLSFDDLNSRLKNLWNFLINQSSLYSQEYFQHWNKIVEETRGLNDQINQKIKSLTTRHEAEYQSFQRECQNLSQIDVEIQGSMMFNGFKESDWDVFNHNLTLNEENLKAVKDRYTEMINPLLLRFYQQIRHDKFLEVKLDYFYESCSQNRQLKKTFPMNRYLFLVKNRDGKWPTTHIGEPSFIISMGKDDTAWFEVRTGVEEIFKAELTPYGERMLVNIKKNIVEVLKRLRALGDGWEVVYGNTEKDERKVLKANKVTSDELVEVIQAHLATKKLADFHIRKKYYLDNLEDKKILTSSKIVSTVAKDINQLWYFFDLAHQEL